MGPRRLIKTLARKLGDDRGGPLVAHWGLTLNYGDKPDALFEILAVSSGWIGQKMKMRVTTAGPDLDRKLTAFWEFDPLGLYTTLDNAEIAAIGEDYVLNHPNYNLLTNNCQHFVKALFKGIRDTGRDGDDAKTDAAIDALETEPRGKSTAGLSAGVLTEVNGFLGEQNIPSLEDLLNIWAGEMYARLDGGESS